MNTFWKFFMIAFSITAAWSIFRNPAEAGCAIILLLLFVVITIGVLIAMFITHPGILLVCLGIIALISWRKRIGHRETSTTD